MKNTITMILVVLAVCFSLLLFAWFTLTDHQNDGDITEMSVDYVGEDEDSPVTLFAITFSPLSECLMDEAGDYADSNDLITIYDVQYKFSVILVYVQLGYVDRSFSNLKLEFELDDGTEEEYTIKSAFPGMKYELIIPRHASNSLQLTNGTWNDDEPELSESREFGFPIMLKGVSTLKYISHKSILVLDDYGVVINELDLDGIGTEILNQGASYYKVVTY